MTRRTPTAQEVALAFEIQKQAFTALEPLARELRAKQWPDYAQEIIWLAVAAEATRRASAKDEA
jgi:hypothetical protein